MVNSYGANCIWKILFMASFCEYFRLKIIQKKRTVITASIQPNITEISLLFILKLPSNILTFV